MPVGFQHHSLSFPCRVGAVDPRRGPRPSRAITKPVDCGLPRERDGATVLKGFAPVVPLAITAGAHERLELPIRDLEPIDPEILDRAGGAEADRIPATGYPHHPLGHHRRSVQAKPYLRWMTGAVDGLKTCF